MSYWMARVLDRANVRVVRWRVGSRQPVVQLSAMRRFAATTRREVQTLEAEPLRPRLQCSSRSGELWRSDQGDWLATRHPGATPGNTALLFLHGWLATPMHLRLMRRAAGPLLADGVELWLPRLPAHLERTPAGSVSGSRCLSADPVATARCVARAVGETRALAGWLRGRGYRVALWGMSLGGWVAALAATGSFPWAAVALWSPVVDPVSALRESPLAAPMRSAVPPEAVDVAATILGAVAPVTRAPGCDPATVAVVAGRYDNVVSPESVRRLQERWGLAVHWFDEGHISILLSRRARDACRRFLRAVLLCERS